MTHFIHLRGPWRVVWQPSGQPCQHRDRVLLPRPWQALFGSEPGTALFRRRFHAPTNLQPSDQLFLELTGVRGCGTVRLNQLTLGQLNGTETQACYPISQTLLTLNELEIELTCDPATASPSGLFGVVRLVIRS